MQREVWECCDPNGKGLPEIINSEHWQYANKAVEMRNNLVHGSGVYNSLKCKEMTENVIKLLDQTVISFETEYGYNGWHRVSIRRKSTLHTDPKVKHNERS